jgi:precorrin-3B C17-methyltransferase
MSARVAVVGLGPGSADLLAPAVREAIASADLIVGYTTYLNLIKEIAPDIPRFSSGMGKEVERARHALQAASDGKNVVVVSSGDPGIYGMAGLIYELRDQRNLEVEVVVIPGISALSAASALLGAPLMVDFAVISLSDHLVPLDEITNRLESAAQSDFVICIYNPKGKKRVEPFEQACEILLRWRSADTLVGVVRNAYRPDQQVHLIHLEDLREADVDMLTLLVIGNSQTREMSGKMVTPRGYDRKYDL